MDGDKMTLTKELNHYIKRNIAASVGLSIYILIDTIFISMTGGSIGMAVLNLSLPLFSLFNCLGMLLGVGGAAYYSLNKLTHPERVETLYSEIIIFAVIIGFLIAFGINLFIHPLLRVLGGNAQTIPMAIPYVRILAFGAPFTICNYVSINFIRNDGNPTLTMMATLIETSSVVVVDWLLIFGIGLHMEGAALAGIFSPVCSLCVLTRHRHFADRRLHWHWVVPKLTTIGHAARLGIAAFLNELSTGVSIYVFNIVLLKLAGNYAIAAYGVISNIAIVTVAIANGVALGVQPIASREYGIHHFKNVRLALKHGLKITVVIAIMSFIILSVFRTPVASIFNSHHQALMMKYATAGLPIYFSSTTFTAINLLLILFLTAIDAASTSFSLSLLRGYIILLPMIVILGFTLGTHGVWAAVPVTELLTTIVGTLVVRNRLSALQNENEQV